MFLFRSLVLKTGTPS